MKRRDFIAAMTGAAALWPIAARAQQQDRQRLIGVLLPIVKDDPEYQPWIAAFRAALQELGWVDGRAGEIRFPGSKREFARIGEIREAHPDQAPRIGILAKPGEAMRGVTWVRVHEVASGQWAIGGKGLTTADIKALQTQSS